jgi:hypothetical protein
MVEDAPVLGEGASDAHLVPRISNPRDVIGEEGSLAFKIDAIFKSWEGSRKPTLGQNKSGSSYPSGESRRFSRQYGPVSSKVLPVTKGGFCTLIDREHDRLHNGNNNLQAYPCDGHRRVP